MDRRLELSDVLHTLAPNVYFQAPPNTGLKFPCILYGLDDAVVQHADNRPFRQTDRYIITVMDGNPDSQIWREIMKLPTAAFVRRYYADQLNHTVINLHF